MAGDLQNPIFTDDTKAREWLEARIWPNGPFCPHCGTTSERVTKLEGEKHRTGLYQCNECREQFTVTVGTVFERSKLPLSKWLMALYLLMASKKGMSTRQVSRMLGVSVKSTWFMTHRLREALRDGNFTGPIGGDNKVIEADETYVGGKAKNRAFAKKPPEKSVVLSLVERDGGVRSYHVPNVTATTLRPIVVQIASRKSWLMSDEMLSYVSIGKEFAGHRSVNHSADEYVRLGGWVHVNTVENYFSILKRGIYGVYQHVSEAHLHRYLGEFDFRHSTRKMSDMERTELAATGIVGKRLTYRRPDATAHA